MLFRCMVKFHIFRKFVRNFSEISGEYFFPHKLLCFLVVKVLSLYVCFEISLNNNHLFIILFLLSFLSVCWCIISNKSRFNFLNVSSFDPQPLCAWVSDSRRKAYPFLNCSTVLILARITFVHVLIISNSKCFKHFE